MAGGTSSRNRGSVRRSQLITTYGVGAIIAAPDGSYMTAGIDRWPVDSRNEIQLRNLARELGVEKFYAPPAGDYEGVPVVRFPTWVSCPECGRLGEHKQFASFDKNECGLCEVPLIPSRFVAVCENGHIDDFPYLRWVHEGEYPHDDKHRLRIEATGLTATLRDVMIACSCDRRRSMAGATGKAALMRVIRCSGRRPWLSDQEQCDLAPRTLQRGASNVYFPTVRSALSIPPWSEGAYNVIESYWSALKHVPDDALPQVIGGMALDRNSSFTVADLVRVVQTTKARESGDVEADATAHRSRADEYDALVTGRSESAEKQDFVCVPAVNAGSDCQEWFDQVMLVKRLREVRALTSFTRIQPPAPGSQPEEQSPLAATGIPWLPAIEVIGEGVFLHFATAGVKEWEVRPSVLRRASKLDENYRLSFASHAPPRQPDREITARELLLHTFAHMLIDQWALESGYPAASLRERLYVSDKMLGVLIYTATSDSQGSLGGVVSQAEEGRLDGALYEGLRRAAWCSSDPLCIEADAAGIDSLNLAACHACVLLPEVSCEFNNTLLDRALLVGTPDDPAIGLFASLVGRE